MIQNHEHYDNNKNRIKITYKQTFDQQFNSFDDTHLPVPRLSLRYAYLTVGVLSLVSYWTGQYATFTFDDNSAILSNKDIQTETGLLNIFANDFWGTNIKSNLSHKSYRPLTVLTFRLNYFVSGGYHPWGFHFTNIVLHVLHSMLLLRVFSFIIGGLRFDENGQRIFTSPKASLLCGILFAVHPVHTESVVAVVGRADLVCGIFFSISFTSYVKYCFAYGERKSKMHLVVCLCSAAIAMFCKEQGITVLGVCIAYEILMVMQLNTDVFLKSRRPNPTKIALSLKRILMVSMCGFVLLTLRLRIMVSGPPKFQYNDNPHSFQDSFIIRIFNYLYLYSLNLWLLLNPWWLCFDWAMGCVPVIQSVSDLRLLAPLFMLMVTISLAIKVLSLLHYHTGRCIAMAVAIMMVTFLPAMNIFFRVGFVVAERNLYIPSIGFVMLVVIGMTMISSTSIVGKKATKASLVFLIMIFTCRSVHRTNDWLTEDTLFKSGLEVCPLNAKVHYNVGKKYQDAGKLDEAVPYYLESIRLTPTYDQPMNNLGNIYKEKEMLKEAEHYHQLSVDVNPIFATGWMNLGTVKTALKKKEEAIYCYQQAVKHRKKYPDAYYNWGNLYLDYKEPELALEKFQISINQKRDHVLAWRNMIAVMGDTGKGDELFNLARKITTIFPQDSQMYYLFGNALGKAEKLQEAEIYIKKSLQFDPHNSNSHGTLGVIYHRLKRYPDADSSYQHALRLNPNNAMAAENYNRLKRVWKKN